MEALIALAVLGLVGALALRFGHDSRDGFSSQEQTIAASEMVWPGPADELELAREIWEARQRRLAHGRADASRFSQRDGGLASAA
jgi:hypothetical protein